MLFFVFGVTVETGCVLPGVTDVFTREGGVTEGLWIVVSGGVS